MYIQLPFLDVRVHFLGFKFTICYLKKHVAQLFLGNYTLTSVFSPTCKSVIVLLVLYAHALVIRAFNDCWIVILMHSSEQLTQLPQYQC